MAKIGASADESQDDVQQCRRVVSGHIHLHRKPRHQVTSNVCDAPCTVSLWTVLTCSERGVKQTRYVLVELDCAER